MSSRNDERSTILTPEKKTHVLLSYDWGIDGSNHQRVKQISDALKSRGLVTWIDDERIVNDIDRKIVDGINHTECMTVFLTENYVSKVDGWNDKDYCKREFNYGFEKLGKDKILVVVLDESLKDSSKWGSTIPFNLGSVLYVDMTETSSSHNSMNDLYQRIVQMVEIADFNLSMSENSTWQMKVSSLLSQQNLVRWNRSKIMLVGQGRAGKTALANNLAGVWIEDTPSTIGAEMDMKLLYGGVKGGRLQEYKRPERELEALLAEQLHYELSDVLSLNAGGLSESELLIEEDNLVLDTLTPTLTLADIRLDEVDLHYKTLQEVDTASSFKLLLIDFGGQSLFNILHGFFMSRYGIYLVVFDMELFMSFDAAGRESCRKELKFWLNSITMHTLDNSTGKTAPVAIVGTRGDKINHEEDYETISLELQYMFGEMMIWRSLILNESLCFFPNNNALVQGNSVTRALLRCIEETLTDADYMKREIPMLWIKILDEMRSKRLNELSYWEVMNISSKRYKDTRNSLGGNEESGEQLKKKIEMEVKNMLRFLNDMGMLMWIEEKDLEDVIILDPIEYLVKPATIIICKHLATNDDPYRTIHHIAEIHAASRKAYGEDWMRMLEYGIVSEVLARDLLMRYYNYQANSNDNISHDVIDKILLLMRKFGLMIPSTAFSISSAEKFYLVPSLLPLDPTALDSNVQDRGIKMMLSRLQKRYFHMLESWNNIESHFSLFCFLPQKRSFAAKFYEGYCVMSSSELSQQGFLPHSLFERMICRLIQSICGHDTNMTLDERLVDNDLIIGFRGKVQLSYLVCDIRIIEKQEENRIEVIVRSQDKDKEREKEVLVEIYKVTAEVMQLSLRECYEALQMKTLIHLPHISSTSTSSKEEGFITLKKVREILSTSHPVQMAKSLHLFSDDANCEITLIPSEMKKDPYWSVWKEKVNIPLLPVNSAILPLKAGKTTHVLLSHDWGIDGSNHHRVKQISDALKSRGLETWIDDEWINNDINWKIIDSIDHTECMIVFLTENYVRKVDSKNEKDYCKREFNYGYNTLGREKMLVVVLDESMRDSSKWGKSIPFNLGSVVDFDMSMIFDPSTSLLEANELIDRLSQQVIEYGKNQWERKVRSLLSQQKLVRWNRSKIMLVGQGRAGKTALANNLAGIWIEDTPSTIGAEMEMKLLYGGVKGGRLQEYKRPERETEALLAEQLHSKTYQESNSSSLPSKGDAERVNEMPHQLDDFHTTNENKSPPSSSKDTGLRKQRDSDLPLVEQKSPETKEYSSISAESVLNDSSQNSAPILEGNENTPEANVALEFVPSDSFIFRTLTLDHIKLDEVDRHYQQLKLDTPSYKLLLVDFGGQSLFNILHGFFMSRYSIYLVVFDMELFMSFDAAKRESCRKELRFWLNSITMHTLDNSPGKTAPVAIVGTRGDKINHEEDYETISLELEKMFGKMVVWQSLIWFKRAKNNKLCFFPNNNPLTEDNPVRKLLLFCVEERLKLADYMKREIPMLWIKIFDEMKALGQSYLSYEDVVKMAKQKYFDGPVNSNDIAKPEVMKEEVKNMLRFLNYMGMLMWIEEKDLEDVIILDPIEYLVKPATTIICKHLATKDDPYGTIHHIEEIHGESKRRYGEDWERMLEFGIVSEELARDLLRRSSTDKLLRFMLKFGLLVPSFSSSIVPIKKSYLVPSLLPSDPSTLIYDKRDAELENMIRRLSERYDQICDSDDWTNIGMHFSLFCFLPGKGLSVSQSSGAYGVISSSELSQKGFLPHSLFERMICRLIQRMCGHDTHTTMVMDERTVDERLVDNDLIIGFRGKVQLSYQDCDIRILERQEENRIEVIVQSRDIDQERGKAVFVEIYEVCVDKMKQSIAECYEELQIKMLIHFPHLASISTSSKEEGFITLEKLKWLLASSNSTQFKGISHDSKCQITLNAGEMKKDPYWSVWKEKEKISTSNLPQPTFSLEKTGEKTHVFLSHDWGIDNKNHHRVKQVNETLKSRGLKTWIDDEWIVNDINQKIIDGIDHTECMIVFLTENYVRKVDGSNDKDYCKREFNYGYKKLGKDKILVVVLDESIKDDNKWGGTIPFNLGSVLYVDMSETSSSNNSMNDLYQRILKIVYPERMVAESKTPVNEGSDTVVKAKKSGGGSSFLLYGTGVVIMTGIVAALFVFTRQKK